MIASLCDLKFERWMRARESGELKWRTKNGDEISIKNLSDRHLADAINILEAMGERDEISDEHHACVND
jgi:hypothetical protein